MKISTRAVVLLLATLVASSLTARLGFWQMDRAAQKQALQAAVLANGAMPPLQTAELSGAQLHRRVQLTGHWLADKTVFLDNRPMAGRSGFYVLTPLQLQGRPELVLVQRGWSPRDAADRSRLQPLPTPTGLVTLTGRLITAPSKVYEFVPAASGVIRQNLDLQALEREVGRPFLPVTVLQQDGEAADGLLRAWAAPDAGLHKHYGYAFQWFSLSALILGLYVWFQTIRVRKQAKSL